MTSLTVLSVFPVVASLPPKRRKLETRAEKNRMLSDHALAGHTVSVFMGDAVQKDRGPLGTRTIIETTFCTRTSHFVFQSE